MPNINKPEMTAKLTVPRINDHEAEMARADLYKMAKYSMKLFQMIQDGQELEGWVQAKITKASDYISSIYHYMEYQTKFGQGNAVTSVDDITDDLQIVPTDSSIQEDDIDESFSYKQRLEALLENNLNKITQKKSK